MLPVLELVSVALVAVVVAGIAVAVWAATAARRPVVRVAAGAVVAACSALTVVSVLSADSLTEGATSPATTGWLLATCLAAAIIPVAAAPATIRKAAASGLAVAVLASGGFSILATDPASTTTPVVAAAPADRPPAAPASAAAPASVADPHSVGMAEDACQDPPTALDCMIEFFTTVAHDQGTQIAIESAVAQRESNPVGLLTQHCHLVLHTMAAVGYGEAAQDPTAALRFGAEHPSACSFGYAHGIWEEFFDAMTLEELMGMAGTVCLENSVEGSFEINACYHILGHEIAKRDYESSPENLSVCDEIPEDSVGGRHSCTAGGFMELFVNDQYIERARTERDPDKMLAYCARALPGLSTNNCYHESGPSVYTAANEDINVAFAACKAATSDPEYLDWCFNGSAGTIATAAGFDPDRSVEMCSSLTNVDERDLCIMEAGRSIAHNFGDAEVAMSVCDHVSAGREEECADLLFEGGTYYRETDAEGNAAEPEYGLDVGMP